MFLLNKCCNLSDLEIVDNILMKCYYKQIWLFTVKKNDPDMVSFLHFPTAFRTQAPDFPV